jgi:tol-pal system protein YbgF
MLFGLLVAGCNTTKPTKAEPQLDQVGERCTDQSSCISLLKKRISSNWRIPHTYKEGMWAKVEVSVDKDYNVINVYTLKNRGDRRFADSIEVAILKSSPFTVLSGVKGEGEVSISKVVLTFNPNPDFQSQSSAHEMYHKAFDYMKLNKLNEAIRQFEMVYKGYPDTKYGMNSQYWLGELHYANSDISQAWRYFERVSSIKDASKRADSLYKLGHIMEMKGDLKSAKAYFMKVLSEYKGTSLARLTHKRMIELGMDVDL